MVFSASRSMIAVAELHGEIISSCRVKRGSPVEIDRFPATWQRVTGLAALSRR